MPRLLPRRTTRRSPRRRTTLVALVASAVVLTVTACGSQLDPDDVASSRGSTSGAALTAPGALGSTSGDPALAPDGAPPAEVDTGTLASGTDGAAAAPSTSGGSGGSGTPPAGAEDQQSDTGGGSGAEDPAAEESATGDGPAGSCDGFRNGPGITDSTITLANAVDISGPVPGLFESARQATQAFVSFYNSTEKLCGRSLELLPLDSRADAGADQQAYATACDKAFAAVGSVSSFDAGGAATAQQCGLPDIRSFIVTPERQQCSTCVAAFAITTDQLPDAIPRYWLQKERDASQHVGIFYVNVAAAKVNAEAAAASYEKAGMNVDVLQPIDTAEFNYATYAQQMKDNDIDFVQYYGPYQFAIKLQQAMKQQSFVPEVYFQDATIYDANYLKQAGDVAKGAYVYSTTELFDDTRIREMALYRSWLERVAPGAVPNYYGLYAWSAARLFVQEATALGGKLTRESLVARMRQVKGWTSNGLHAPMSVGSGATSPCVKIIQYDGSSWRSVSGSRFTCGGIIDVG